MQVFFPYVALYLGAAFLQGGAGTGANGFLNNLRGWLWIPISQSAYRTIALDLFSHVLDLDLKFHLMCVARLPNPSLIPNPHQPERRTAPSRWTCSRTCWTWTSSFTSCAWRAPPCQVDAGCRVDQS